MQRETLDQLLADQAAKRPVVVATSIASSEATLLYPGETPDDTSVVMAAARDAVLTDRSRTVETDQGDLFLNVFNPPLRLIIIGAVHIAQPLSEMAGLTGYDVIVVDPRTAFASDLRFPSVTIMTDWPDEALDLIGPDARTAVVALTHDPKIDDPGLDRALRSDCFYIGALGSKRTHAKRVQRLQEAGFKDDAIARIHGPIGLDLGGRAPSEIAVSIIAEITQTLRGGG